MKLPTIAPTVTVPDQIPTPYASPEAFGAGYGAAAQGFRRVGEAANQVIAAQNQADAELAKAERKMYEQGVSVESTTLKTRMDVDTGAALEDLKVTERDPDAYLEGATKIIQDAYDKISKQAKYPESKQALSQHLLHLQATRGLEAKKYSIELYDQRNAALRDEGLESLKILGANAPDTPRQEGEGPTASLTRGAGDYLVAGLDLINQSTRNEKERADLKIRFKNEFLKERGVRAIQDNPDANIEPLKTRLPGPMYDDLVQKQTAAVKTRNEAWDKYYDRMEKDAEAERQVLLTKARESAQLGQMTSDKIHDLIAMRVIVKPEEESALRAAMTQTKDEPSHQDTLDRLTIKVHRAIPTATQGELDAAKNDKKLNNKDYRELSDKLTSRSDHLTGENRTVANTEMTRAFALLRAHSGIATEFDKLEADDQYLLTSGEREVVQRSSHGGLGGTEKAVEVAMEVGKRILDQRQPKLNLNIQMIRGTLKFQAETAEEAKSLVEEKFKAGLITEGGRQAEMVKIIDLARAEKAQQAATQKASETKKSEGKSVRPKTGKE